MKMPPPHRQDLTELIFLKPKQRTVACWILKAVLQDSPISATRLSQECRIGKPSALKIIKPPTGEASWIAWSHMVLMKIGPAQIPEKALLTKAVNTVGEQAIGPDRTGAETGSHRRENGHG